MIELSLFLQLTSEGVELLVFYDPSCMTHIIKVKIEEIYRVDYFGGRVPQEPTDGHRFFESVT
jgi:hypothetical protein